MYTTGKIKIKKNTEVLEADNLFTQARKKIYTKQKWHAENV